MLITQTGLAPSIGLAALCGVYGLAYGIQPSVLAMLSATCLFWILYLADRLAEEAPPPDHPAAFVRRRPRLMWGMLAVAVCIELLACVIQPRWFLPILGSLACGAAYFTPVPLLGRPIKDIAGTKSFYAATVILAICHLYVWPAAPSSAGQRGVLVAILLIEQISNAIYDLKDIEADRRNGIRTLVMIFGRERFLAIEGCAALLGCAVVLAWPTPATPALAAAFLLHLAAAIVCRWRPFDDAMTVWLDMAYSLIVFTAVLTA